MSAATAVIWHGMDPDRPDVICAWLYRDKTDAELRAEEIDEILACGRTGTVFLAELEIRETYVPFDDVPMSNLTFLLLPLALGGGAIYMDMDEDDQ